MSNTKLSKVQKMGLVEMQQIHSEDSGELYFFPDVGLTVAMLPAGNVCRVATAINSPWEKKFRRKVGAFKALERLENGEDMLILMPVLLKLGRRNLRKFVRNCLA